MRTQYYGFAKDGNGKVINEATISVFLAGGTTVASIYAAATGGTAVNSVASGSDGKYSFFVDDGDYFHSQKFKLTISKSGYQSYTIDNVSIFPALLKAVATVPDNADGDNGDAVIIEGTEHCIAWKAGDIWYKAEGTVTT